jgi:hypothetical protein
LLRDRGLDELLEIVDEFFVCHNCYSLWISWAKESIAIHSPTTEH